jgi:anti-sigma factor RsiW
MIRQDIEQYLDGELSPAEAAVLHADPASAALIASARNQRALRAAAYATYQASAAESDALTEKILTACADDRVAPIAHIGPWLRRASAVAAVLALIIGGFAAGRMSAPAAQAPAPAVAANEIIRVLYNDDAGEAQMKEFDSIDDANNFMKDMSARHAEPVVVASTFDTDHPGSF